jgi:hypothetical protein
VTIPDPPQPAEPFVRLSLNISPVTAEAIKATMDRLGIPLTEAIRRAAQVWKFAENEAAAGNQLAVIEPDGTVRKVELLPPSTGCPARECDGYGCVWTDPHTCTCGAGPAGYMGQHEPYCGAEPCPAGCEFKPRPAPAAPEGAPGA